MKNTDKLRNCQGKALQSVKIREVFFLRINLSLCCKINLANIALTVRMYVCDSVFVCDSVLHHKSGNCL